MAPSPARCRSDCAARDGTGDIAGLRAKRAGVIPALTWEIRLTTPALLELIADVLVLSEDVLWAVDINHGGAALLIGLLLSHQQPDGRHHRPRRAPGVGRLSRPGQDGREGRLRHRRPGTHALGPRSPTAPSNAVSTSCWALWRVVPKRSGAMSNSFDLAVRPQELASLSGATGAETLHGQDGTIGRAVRRLAVDECGVHVDMRIRRRPCSRPRNPRTSERVRDIVRSQTRNKLREPMVDGDRCHRRRSHAPRGVF
jgi:hypothetical protein